MNTNIVELWNTREKIRETILGMRIHIEELEDLIKKIEEEIFETQEIAYVKIGSQWW